jgi:hypothetical protein
VAGGAGESSVDWFDLDGAEADWTDECVFHSSIWRLLQGSLARVRETRRDA